MASSPACILTAGSNSKDIFSAMKATKTFLVFFLPPNTATSSDNEDDDKKLLYKPPPSGGKLATTNDEGKGDGEVKC